MRRLLCFWLLLLTLASSLSAGDVAPRATDSSTAAPSAEVDFSYSPNWPAPPDTNGMLLRLAVGTLATLGLCVATLVLGRRWLQRPSTSSESRKLQIEESVVLGHRATLFLVRIGENRLVAGTDAAGLKSLIVLPTSFPEVLDQHVEADDRAAAMSLPLTATVVEHAAQAA